MGGFRVRDGCKQEEKREEAPKDGKVALDVFSLGDQEKVAGLATAHV